VIDLEAHVAEDSRFEARHVRPASVRPGGVAPVIGERRTIDG
jgi:hypothetical protein